MNKKVWFITGASKGLGLSLTKKLLAAGHFVTATTRNIASLQKEIGNSFESQFMPVAVDLTDDGSVKAAVEATVAKFGKIDVLVNNAGYGIGGAVEELSNKEIKDSFDVNVFAMIRTIQQVVPFMRKQESGHVINISSIAGFAPGTGWSMYAATKFAVIGLSEGLALELKQFGIKVTAVAPGAFRTQFLSGGSLVYSDNKIPAYTDVRASHQKYGNMDGKQAGDPEKAADAFIALADAANPPVTLFLGSDAVQRATDKLNVIKSDLDSFRSLSVSTDY